MTGRRPADGRVRVNVPAPRRATADPDPGIAGSTDPATTDPVHPVQPVHPVRGGIVPLKVVRRPTAADATGHPAPTSGARSIDARPARGRRVHDHRVHGRPARRIAHGRTGPGTTDRAKTDRGSGAPETTGRGRSGRETIGRGADRRTERGTIDHRATIDRRATDRPVRDRRSNGARSASLPGRSGRRRCRRQRSSVPTRSS